MCPNNSPAGCVAIAMAQMMKYGEESSSATDANTISAFKKMGYSASLINGINYTDVVNELFISKRPMGFTACSDFWGTNGHTRLWETLQSMNFGITLKLLIITKKLLNLACSYR